MSVATDDPEEYKRVRRRMALSGPLKRRPTRAQMAALTMITLMALGPIGALAIVFGTSQGPVPLLIEGVDPPADGARLVVNLLTVVPTSGTAIVTVQVQPQGSLVSREGLAVHLQLRANDAKGETLFDFPANEALLPATITLALDGASVARYPFDTYETALLLKVERVDGDVAETIESTIEFASEEDDFDIVVENLRAGREVPSGDIGIPFEMNRRSSTIVYAVGVALLMWGLAAIGVLVTAAVVVWGIEIPFWTVGYHVGVLFSLPPMRNSLPGSPTPGTLLDFVSFYWAIAITGANVIVIMLIWLQRVRPARGVVNVER